MKLDDAQMKFEFWHRPDLAEDINRPYAFVVRAFEGSQPLIEMGAWFDRQRLEGYILEMQQALAGETCLNKGAH